MFRNIFAGTYASEFVRKFLTMWIINLNRLPECMFEMVIRKPCKPNFLMENVVMIFACELPLQCVTFACSSL